MTDCFEGDDNHYLDATGAFCVVSCESDEYID